MNATYSVAWINTTNYKNDIGQSLVMLGEHASIEDTYKKKIVNPLKLISKKKRNIPLFLPNWFIGKRLITLFNYVYYLYGKYSSKIKLVNWDSYFYPLDGILGWNKVYGRKGFVQYQCVLPLDKSKEGLIKLLKEISNSKVSSFLTVLKGLVNKQVNSHFQWRDIL